MIRSLLVILSVIFISSFCSTQDNVAWNGFKVKKKINQKLLLDVTPILRLHQDLSEYQNSSIDISLNYTFKPGWSVQALSRTWFMPDRSDRQFFWVDVAHTWKKEKMTLKNRLRNHRAFDIGGFIDNDYLRYMLTYVPTTFSRWSPVINLEPWLQFNGINDMTRFRTEIGGNISLSDSWKLLLMYRRQDELKVNAENDLNMAVITLTRIL